MRYSRFKQQMEGITPQVRKPRATKNRDKADGTAKANKKRKRDEETQVEQEDNGASMPMAGVESTAPSLKPEPAIKNEPSITSEQIKPEPIIKEESMETGLASFPAAPRENFFSLPEDLQLGLEANNPSVRQDLQSVSEEANTPSVPQDLQPRPQVNAPSVPQPSKQEPSAKVKTEHEI
ncbi:MAG: hypothetical protein Q9179_004760 [Wetmoreana sp. 5 TL-2023]